MRHTCFAFTMLLLAPPAFAAVQQPTGEGEPKAWSCQEPQALPGSRLPGPQICKRNDVWAQYRKDGMAPAPDGRHDVPAEKSRTLNQHYCHPATAGGSGTANAIYTNFSMICD
jgi:hypothetical protein